MKRGNLEIPKLEIQPIRLFDDYQTRLYLQYSRIIETNEPAKELLADLKEDPRVKSLEGKMISNGNGAGIFEAKKLAMWVLWVANEHGKKQAFKFLNSFLNEDKLDVVNVLWVSGLEVTESIPLKNGYSIIPITEMPDSREKEIFLQIPIDYASYHGPNPKSAIIYQGKVQKEFDFEGRSEDSDFLESGSVLNEIALLLNALPEILCVPSYSTSYALPPTPFGPFNRSGGGFHMFDVLGSYGNTKLTKDRIDEIEELISNFAKLPLSGKSRFLRVLNRLSQAKRRDQIEDKILDLGIVLEMLLLEDNKGADQLSLTFRLRGSWLLGETGIEREEIYNQLKALYSYRSQVAHNGILCKGSERKIDDVRKAFPKYQMLAEKICRKLLEKGKPNWDELILANIENRN